MTPVFFHCCTSLQCIVQVRIFKRLFWINFFECFFNCADNIICLRLIESDIQILKTHWEYMHHQRLNSRFKWCNIKILHNTNYFT